MTRRKWTITTELTGKTREVEVFLYDDLKTFRAAASRWTGEPGEFSGGLACVHTFVTAQIGADGSEVESPRVGIVRFVRGHLSPEIISHEAGHLALGMYGFDNAENIDAVGSANEEFCYLLGGLFSTLWKMLREEM